MRIERQAPRLKGKRKRASRTYRHYGGHWRDTDTGQIVSWAKVKRSRAAKRGVRKADFYQRLAQELAETSPRGYVWVEDISQPGTPATAVTGLSHSWHEVGRALQTVERHPYLKTVGVMHVSAEFALDGDFRRVGWRNLSRSNRGDVAVSQAAFKALMWAQRYKETIVKSLAFILTYAKPEVTPRTRRRPRPPKNLRGRGPK